MTTEAQKGRGPQKYTSAPQEVYSNLASYTCRIYIYRDMMADVLLLKKVLSSEMWAKRKMRERERERDYSKITSHVYEISTVGKKIKGTWCAKMFIRALNIFVSTNGAFLYNISSPKAFM